MAIVKTLASFRAKEANLRHRENFYWQRFENDQDPAKKTFSDVAQYLPPRREWSRPNRAQRHSSHRPSVDVSRDSIYRRVQGVYHSGRLLECEWGCRLSELVKRIQTRVATGDFTFDRPELMLRTKAVGAGCQPKFRCIAAYRNLEDRVILSIANKYLSSKLDGVLSNNSYAFRTRKKSPVARAVGRIIDFRNGHTQVPLYVAECDIVKFFDTIEHKVVFQVFEEFCDKVVSDDKLKALIKAFLGSYNICDIMNSEFWNKLSKTGDWEFLAKLPRDRRVGLPQGGALSGLLSNLVLDRVDKAISDLKLDDVLYVRYCDDIIILGKNQMNCKKALDACSGSLENLNLKIYPPNQSVSYGVGYYVAKSKGPFLWGNPAIIPDAIPWVSFLGYSIRYDGSTRLRKETLLGHAKSIREECETFLKNARKFGFRNPLDKAKVVEDLLCRLIAKGTGRINVEPVKGLGRCWLAVFRFVGGSKLGLKQMRYLDYIRSSSIARLLRKLNVKRGESPDKNTNACLYFGKPFSYYGSCEKLKRQSLVRDRAFSLCEDKILQDGSEPETSSSESSDTVNGAKDESLNTFDKKKDIKPDDIESRDVDVFDDGDVRDEEYETSGWERARGYGG